MERSTTRRQMLRRRALSLSHWPRWPRWAGQLSLLSAQTQPMAIASSAECQVPGGWEWLAATFARLLGYDRCASPAALTVSRPWSLSTESGAKLSTVSAAHRRIQRRAWNETAGGAAGVAGRAAWATTVSPRRTLNVPQGRVSSPSARPIKTGLTDLLFVFPL